MSSPPTLFTTLPSKLLHDKKIVIVMVGLPARGKSYISQKLKRWLCWMGYPTQVFNVGNYRRQKVKDSSDHHFFDHHDKEKNLMRDELALDVLESLLHWLKHEGGCVGIHDATNTTKERRDLLLQRISKESGVDVLFLESVCGDPAVLEANISMKTRSPDYINMDPGQARDDFIARLANYASVYQPIEEDAPFPYIKVIDVGKRVMASNIQGYLQSEAVLYLLNMHIQPRKIWITRHGQSEDNVDDRIGGDSNLTSRGQRYAHALTHFINSLNCSDLTIWTSCLTRALQTVKHLETSYETRKLRTLNEIYAGSCEGMTYHEIEEKQPDIAKLRSQNKLSFRYPGGGESYLDVIERVKPLIIELERLRNNVLIISHRAVLRAIFAYFLDVKLDDLPHIDVPLHTVLCLTPTPYGCEMQKFNLEHLMTDEAIAQLQQQHQQQQHQQQQ